MQIIFTFLTENFISVIISTLVGPSVATLTVRNPEPGLSLCFSIACSIGVPSGIFMQLTGAGGPRTTSLPGKRNLHSIHQDV